VSALAEDPEHQQPQKAQPVERATAQVEYAQVAEGVEPLMATAQVEYAQVVEGVAPYAEATETESEGESEQRVEDEWERWRRDPQEVMDVRTAEYDSKNAIKALCANGGGAPVRFIATSKFAFFGEQSAIVRYYLMPVAVEGTIRFTRNRTRPNVFTFENVDVKYDVPAGFPTDAWGAGDDTALAKAEAKIRELIRDKDVYDYRDRDRVTFGN